MSRLRMPHLVIVHDPEHGDIERLRQAARIPAPVEITSFTNTGEPIVPAQFKDDDISKVHNAAAFSDILLLQTDVENDCFTLTDVAMSGIHLSSRIHRVGLFDDDYEVMWTTGEQE